MIMFFKVLRYTSRIPKQKLVRLKTTSVLYVTGEKANKQVSIISPYLDFSDRFKDISNLERNIHARKLNFNIQDIQEQWKLITSMKADKMTLEKQRSEIANKIRELKMTGDSQEIEKYKILGRLLRDDLKTLTKSLWKLEEAVVLKGLTLPNVLHLHTPLENEVVIKVHGSKPHFGLSESHLEIGIKSGMIDFIEPTRYYLLGEASLFEMSIIKYFRNALSKWEFVPFSNTDLVRAIIVEGCGVDFQNAHQTFLLKPDITYGTNQLHLVGGASLEAFCAYFAKQVITDTDLPSKHFAIGRQYIPMNSVVKHKGLFDISQSSSIEVFIVTSGSSDSMMTEFTKLCDVLTDIYKHLGYHFQIVYVPAFLLKQWESLRASVQMFSPHLNSYIEVGNISICGSYISKRLCIHCKTESNDKEFVNIICGTVVSVPRLIGCAIEYDYCHGKYLTIPESIKCM